METREPDQNEIDRLTADAMSGDKTALWQVLCLYRPRIEFYLEEHFPKGLRPHLEPQDILQDVYFQVFRRIGQFRPVGEGALYRWILTIARNLLTDALRAHKSVKRGGAFPGGRLSAGWVRHSGELAIIQMLEELAVYHRTPSRSAMAHEMVLVMERALDRLPEDHREVLRLRYLEGMDFSAVAARTGRTPEALQMQCTRAIKLLRTEMTQNL